MCEPYLLVTNRQQKREQSQKPALSFQEWWSGNMNDLGSCLAMSMEVEPAKAGKAFDLGSRLFVSTIRQH
jgi:hypothetical protein